MLVIKVAETESYDETAGQFVKNDDSFTLELEHSLVSLSKWESIWEKPFLNSKALEAEEVISYIECMIVGDKPSPEQISRLTEVEFEAVNAYIAKRMTATTFRDMPGRGGGGRGEYITSELIYYWMTTYQIPFQPAESWHLNRLLVLVRVCSEKNKPAKKMGRRDQAAQQRLLNQSRQKQFGTRG